MQIKPLLFITLAFVSFLLWQEWDKDYGSKPTTAIDQTAGVDQATAQDIDSLPALPDLPTADIPAAAPQQSPSTLGGHQGSLETVPSGTIVTVRTDVLELKIDTVGANIVFAELLGYPVNRTEDKGNILLFNRDAGGTYVAQSGLRGRDGKAPDHRSIYRADAENFEMADGDDQLKVVFQWQDESGTSAQLTYEFERGSYLIKQSLRLQNDSDRTWIGSRYNQLRREYHESDKSFSLTNPAQYSYFGAAVYSPEDKFQELPFDEFQSDPFNQSFSGGWQGMLQHYFVGAWIPAAEDTESYSTRSSGSNYYLSNISAARQVPSGESTTFISSLYLGPKLQREIAEISPGLDLTVDYGIFTIFSKPLFWLLNFLHSFLGNWGWSIVFLTLSIKLAFFKLTEAQYKSMARMRKLQPRMVALKERFGGDKQRLNQATMELYKQEKVNPLGGCLPMVIQIPVFIALYWVLLESVELRQAPFILWLQDLSAPDPYFVLPVINGLAMLATQKLTPMPSSDPMQQKMMMALPVVFSVMFAFFQSGLVLYWSINSVLSLAQQYIITKRIEAADTAK